MADELQDHPRHTVGRRELAEAKPSAVRYLRDRMEMLDAEITKNARSPWFKN